MMAVLLGQSKTYLGLGIVTSDCHPVSVCRLGTGDGGRLREMAVQAEAGTAPQRGQDQIDDDFRAGCR